MKQQKFDFTPEGVNEWRTDVDGGGQSSIDDECEAIENDFIGWIGSRFDLNEDQMQFVRELDSLLTQSYGAALRYALQYGVAIQLEKTETKAVPSRNPKVIAMDEKIKRWRGEKMADNEYKDDKITFRIEYEEEQ